jgi:hypothetical protein
VDIPADTPDSITTGTFDLKSEILDTTFPAESFLSGLQELVPIPQLPIEIGCRNCSTRGQVTLTQGAIKIDLSQIDLIPDIFQGGDDGKEITSVVTGGFIELSATGVGAHIELFARPKQSGAFEVALFPLPILGFVIPGIGQAGAVFEPRIAADFNISGGFELNYGIDVAVSRLHPNTRHSLTLQIPDNSNVRLELTNIANSGVNGFPGSTLTPLPFKVNITDVDILLGLAFKPTIPVGFEFADKLKAEVFVSMNLPRLDAKLSTNAAANCGNSSSNATTPPAPYANKTTELAGNLLSLGSLVLVEANVSLTIDVGAGLTIPLLPPPFGDVSLDANIFSTVFPLVTACVDAAKSFPPMTAVAGNATTTPCSTTPDSNSTVYVTATKTQTLIQTHTSAAHMNTTRAGVTSSHAASSTPVIGTVSKSTHTVASMPVSSHVIATSHVMQTASKPAHTVEPMPVSNHVIPTTHIPSNSSTPTTSPSIHTTQILQFLPVPSQKQTNPNRNSTTPLYVPSHLSSSTVITPALSTAITSSISSTTSLGVPALPVVVMSSGFMNASNSNSNSSAQQTGLAEFTGAGVRGVNRSWTSLAVGVGVLGSVMVGVVM